MWILSYEFQPQKPLNGETGAIQMKTHLKYYKLQQYINSFKN